MAQLHLPKRNTTIQTACARLALLALVALASGCQQGTAVPNPMTAFAPSRVPPPATGSYQIPDRYYKGQANTSGGQSAVNLASNNVPIGSEAVGSGVVQSSFVDRNSSPPPAATVTQSGGDLGSYRGFASTAPSIPQAALTTQPATTNTQFAGQQDQPPAPMPARPSTTPLNWQKPIQ